MQTLPHMQVERPLPEVSLPEIYNIPQEDKKESFKETIKKMDMMGLVYPWLEHPLMMLGTCAGLSWGVDKFSRACGGHYETSLVGKAAQFGDSIQESKFVQSKPFQSVWGVVEKAKNKIINIFPSSDLMNAIRNTPSQAELQFVKDELLTMQQRVVHDFTNVTNKLIFPENRDGSKFVKLSDLGVDKSEREFLKNFFSNTAQTEEMYSNAVQLKRLGLADDAIQDIISKPESTEIVKARTLEKLGVDEEFLNKLKENPATKDDIAKVREACNKAKAIRIGEGHQKFLGPVQPFARKIGLDEVGNRLTSMCEPGIAGGPRTKTGKIMATFLQKCHRGFTFGGGKMGVLFFVTPLLVETMLDVAKADKKEKAGTAAHGLVHSVSWVFTFPLALSLMHRFGGSLKYAGMSPEDVKTYREKIAAFNEKADPYCKDKSMGRWFKNLLGFGTKKPAEETFQSYEEYKVAKDKVKEELKALSNKNSKNQTLLTKIGKQIGKFLTIDLENLRSYRNGSGPANFIRRLPSFGRNIVGVPLRIGIWAGLTMGVLDGIINKGIKGCFGNHYDRYKDEEIQENKKAQKEFLKKDLRSRLVETQREKVYGTQSVVEESPQNTEFKDEYQEVISNKIKNKMGKINENNDTISKNSITKEVESKNIEAKSNMQKNENTKSAASDLENNVENVDMKTITEEPSTKYFNENSAPNDLLAEENEVVDNTLLSKQEKLGSHSSAPASINSNIQAVENKKRDNYTYIPSSENVIKKAEGNSETKKYIPSQQAAKFTKTFDNSGLDAALKRADRAEKRALETLAGNFNSYQ